MNKLNKFVEDNFKTLMKIFVPICLSLILTASFVVGTVNTDADDSEWKDNIIFKANVDIANQGEETVEELLAKEIAITDVDDLSEFIKQQEALLDKLLREYYEAKVSGLVSEKDLDAIMAQIENIRANLLIEYKRQIDKELENFDL